MTPLASCMRRPQKPDAKVVSVTVICQLVGSVVPVGQTLAYKVVPTTRNRNVYNVPTDAEKGVEPIMVVDPATFFWTTSVVPLIYALYQLLLSVQRNTAPRLLFV